jgi:hypothetical protein
MKDSWLGFGIRVLAVSVLSPAVGFSQAAQTRIPQQIVINGQLASGAYVANAGGQMQSFSCPNPQQYATADGGASGWACYEQTTGVWLLNAVPPTSAQTTPAPAPAPHVVPQPPPVIYQQAPPAVVYPQVQPAVVYQPAPAPVIYQQPPTVIYQQPVPTVVYAPAPRPVVVAPAYPSSVILGRAAIDAAGRIASAAILKSRRTDNHYYYYDDDDRYDRKHHNRNRGRRW